MRQDESYRTMGHVVQSVNLACDRLLRIVDRVARSDSALADECARALRCGYCSRQISTYLGKHGTVSAMCLPCGHIVHSGTCFDTHRRDRSSCICCTIESRMRANQRRKPAPRIRTDRPVILGKRERTPSRNDDGSSGTASGDTEDNSPEEGEVHGPAT